MCGIFGVISNNLAEPSELESLARLAQQRGRDSSGIIQFTNSSYEIYRADYSILNLLKKILA